MEPKVRRTSPGFAGWAKIFNLWFQWVAIALDLRKIRNILEASWSHLHAPSGRVKVVPLDGRPSPSDKSGSPRMTGGTWEDILDVCITLHYTVYKRLGSWSVVQNKGIKGTALPWALSDADLLAPPVLAHRHQERMDQWLAPNWPRHLRFEFSLRWKTHENSCPAHLEAVWCPVNRVGDDYSVRDDFRKLCPCHSCCYEG